MGTRVLLVGMQNAVATAEDIMAVPQKFKTKILKIKNRINISEYLYIIKKQLTTTQGRKKKSLRIGFFYDCQKTMRAGNNM